MYMSILIHISILLFLPQFLLFLVFVRTEDISGGSVALHTALQLVKMMNQWLVEKHQLMKTMIEDL